MTCKACQERIKNWKGDDPKCAFEKGTFDGADNWNCALVYEIRELAMKLQDERIQHYCPEHQHYATISLFGGEILPEEDGDGLLQAQPVCLWVGWYKQRGRTEAMWLMFENDPPRQPTEEECLKILERYKEEE